MCSFQDGAGRMKISSRGSFDTIYQHMGRGDSTMASLHLFAIRPSMVRASPGMVAMAIHTLTICYQLIQPVQLNGVTKTMPCVTMFVR